MLKCLQLKVTVLRKTDTIRADHAVTTINVYIIIVNILIDLIFKILFNDNG